MNRLLVVPALILGLFLLLPRSVPAAADSPNADDRWDDRFYGGFGSPSFLQALSDGSVLAVGNLGPNGPIAAGSGVLRWRRDSGWEAAAGPLGGQLRAAALFRGEIHVAGSSLTAEGASVPGNVARWRDATWSDLAGGLAGSVFAMTPHEDRLYVGGSLQAAGDVAVQNVARWDGASWSAVGEGVPFRVRAMAVFRGRLIAAGEAATPEARGGILEWTGAAWQPLGEGVAGTTAAAGIQTLLPLGDSLYAGGNFSQAGSQPARNVARWDGTQWHPVGDGPRGAGVSALATLGNQIAAGAAELSVWDGTSWNMHGGADLISQVNPLSLASSGPDLMALGFSRNPVAGGPQTVVLVRADGVEIQGLGSRNIGLPEMNALAASATGVVLGGAFRAGQGQLWECLARWNGRTWDSLDRGLNYGTTGLRVRVLSVAASNDEILAGGAFPRIGTNQFNHIARWDGARWLPLGSGVPSFVTAVAWLGDRIIAATENDGVLTWDGHSWHSLGVPPPLRYQALAVSGHDVFAAGVTSVAGTSPGVILRWDGRTWTELAAHLQSQTLCLYHDGQRLYAGGRFTEIQGVATRGIAAWDGVRWAPVAGGLPPDSPLAPADQVRVITRDGTGRLFVGGAFIHAASGATHVARIEGDAWHALGSGVEGYPVTAMAWWNGGLLIGGAFHRTGGKSALALGLWHDPVTPYELDLHAPRRVPPDATFDVDLLVRRVPGWDPQPANVRLVIPAGATFVSADAGGTESMGTIIWPIEATPSADLVLRCRLRAPATESLLVLDGASIRSADHPLFHARSHSTVVAMPGPAPTVRLSQPATSPFVARTPLILQADVDPGGSAPASVEFFAGTTRIATASEAPWRAEWNAPVPGSTVFRAVLIDASGRTTASLPVRIELRAPPVNDDFAARIPLAPFTREPFTPGNTVDADPLGATVEAGEPEHLPGIPAQRSLWWSFLPPADGRISFTVSREGIRVRLYTGPDLAGLTPVDSTSPDLTIPVQRHVPYSIAADYSEGLDVTAWTYRYEAAGGRFARASVLSPDLMELLFESAETREHTLEGSTNLVDWQAVMTFLAPQGWHPLQVPRPAESAHQFFRVR